MGVSFVSLNTDLYKSVKCTFEIKTHAPKLIALAPSQDNGNKKINHFWIKEKYLQLNEKADTNPQRAISEVPIKIASRQNMKLHWYAIIKSKGMGGRLE